MTPDHIKFEPLILPRKTPAEEAREHVKLLESKPTTKDALASANALAARLETPGAPKRWDGVFPWVRNHTVGTPVPVVHFAENLIFYSSLHVITSAQDIDVTTPYHDGVIITITAGLGDEFPRVHQSGLNFYLVLAEYSFVVLKVEDCPALVVGQVCDSKASCNGHPLPPGTVTRITINNTLPTTEQRYSVEVVEPEKPKYTPNCKTLDIIQGVQIGQDPINPMMGKPLGYPVFAVEDWLFSIDAVRQLIQVAQSWLSEHDPQEQPATVVVAEGLPLEMRCAENCHSIIRFSRLYNGRLAVYSTRDTNTLSPADEARLRNLLNQRHADGKGGAS